MARESDGRRGPRESRGPRFRMFAVAMFAVVVGAALAGVPLLAPATPAWAHAYLIGTTPADGATVDRVAEVVLDFDEELIDFGPDVDPSSVLVTDESGLHYETGCAVTVGPRISVPVALGEPGEYTASWRSVTIEGHVIRGDVEFSYAPPEFEIATAGAAEPRCDAAGAVGGAGGAAGTLGIVALGASALIAVGVASTMFVVRTRPPRPSWRRRRRGALPPPGSRRAARLERERARGKLERT
ncbi:hypothetical protein ARHIZOSPH14_16350 [Agromyces rhizosphaerae]|uniref:CopC domain-containing protein n=1 Tax=Agromyces rhizosphaerae TaxID=88374 RepID=A0A9W6FRR8_9MICO|nr:copper resistance CopC family protein [Agromyces rhizosphaerae]GLI27393.1 hypothetical protein ARHIZOSPH14_16350 [Agromyces rhizosphaerae]